MHNSNIGIKRIRKNLISLEKNPVIQLKKLQKYSGQKANPRFLSSEQQGRDTLFFAKKGFQVHALDYSENAVEAISQKAQKLGVSQSITAVRHDIRKPLPFADGSFDACYCHMLYCMALCTSELESLFQEVRRVLKPKGLNIYTVRHTGDAHYRKGIHRGEDIYEVEGFIVHFFSKEKVEHLAKGYEIISIDEFEEGELPRKLFIVVLRKEA